MGQVGAALVGAWLALHVLGVAMGAGNAGQMPAWSTPEQYLGALPASIWRWLSLLAMAGFFWGWVQRRSSDQRAGLATSSGNIPRLAKAAGAGCAGFVVLHAWHLRAHLGSGGLSGYVSPSAAIQDRAYTVSDHLAATLSATYWGIPWLALGYLIGAISMGIFVGCELWLATQRRSTRPRWRQQRTYAALSILGGVSVSALLLRALLYLATGSHVG